MNPARIIGTIFILLLTANCGSGIFYRSNLTSTLTLTPASGPVGTLVTVSGMDFSTVSAVSVSGTAAIPINFSSLSLTALVMPGTVSGSMSVTTAEGIFAVSGNFTVTATGVPVTQQGAKLVGTGATSVAALGSSVAVSADGNTALVGGPTDNGNAGAFWVFARSGGTWSQQGSKLVGTTSAGAIGGGVALSADGNTALVGGPGDGGGTGSVCVFTRSGGAWTQQGGKLVGSGVGGSSANQGIAVALSADGNTAFVGGPGDNANTGAVWVFTRSGGVWSQLGGKILGTGATGAANQGSAVALSADGNTALVGRKTDTPTGAFGVGAVWVFARSGNSWNQQGNKLVGTGAAGLAGQGSAVALSADGTTALMGGPNDNTGVGAVWVFTQSGGTWTQQGAKLLGTGSVAQANQGTSVALSADGTTALVGGPSDNSSVGATWVFARSSGAWTQAGAKLVGASSSSSPETQGTSVALSADGTTALVGGPGDNTNAGAAWIFTPLL